MLTLDFLTLRMAIALFIIVLGSLILVCKKWYTYRIRRMRLLQDHNIPGPKPNLFWGNIHEYNSTPNVIWDSQLIKKYGHICGYYIGAKPVIVIAEPDLIRQIQEVNGKNFQERPRRVPGGINPDPIRAKMLGNLPVHEWKELRKILSKSFRPSMLKSITSDITRLIEELMNQLLFQTQCNTKSAEVDLYPLFQSLSFEFISQTGFGIHSNFDEDYNLKTAVEEEFSKSTTSFLTKLCLSFPELGILQHTRIFFQKIKNIFGKSNGSALRNLCHAALQKRLNEELPRNDILQVMLESVIKNDTSKVLANSILFYEAAYETLSASLAFTIHLLINNLDVQEKVRDEIRNVLEENDGLITAESVKNLKYLDAVIKESLRMYPPQTTFISRSGVEDMIYKRDEEIICTIPKGVQIQIALYQIQNSPKFWDEPEMFKPERHLEGEKCSAYNVVYQPFGRGRRECIGYSYAKLVLPLVLATILSKYFLSPSPKTEKTVTLIYKTATMTPKNGCFGNIQTDSLVV